jgi:hypothetical protein
MWVSRAQWKKNKLALEAGAKAAEVFDRHHEELDHLAMFIFTHRPEVRNLVLPADMKFGMLPNSTSAWDRYVHIVKALHDDLKEIEDEYFSDSKVR